MSILLFSCKKSASSGNGSGTISATVNGVNETFNTEALAVQLNTAGTYFIEITGSQGTVGSSDQLTFSIGGTQAIIPGTYQISTSNTSRDATYLTFTQYASGSGNEYITDPPNATYPFTVIITSVSSTNIQGTFSGVGGNINGGPNTETLSNGKFNVSIKQ
jgi:hypothetical protein